MHILLTSAGRRSYLIRYFQDALAHVGGLVHAANSYPNSVALEVADRAVVTPLIYDGDYIQFLLEYCTANQITLLISMFDIDLPILSANKEKFKAIGVTVVVADSSVLDVCNDKFRTYQFLKKNGLDAPWCCLSEDSLRAALENGLMSYPAMVKPRWGMGSIGLYRCDNEAELKVLGERVKREIFQSYLKYESESTPDEAVLYQEFLVGEEFGLDVINDLEGKHVCTVVKKKFGMRSGETDSAIVVEDLKLKDLGAKLADRLRHVGNLDVDVIRSAGGRDSILEMNARFGGHYPFSHLAGVDLPRAIIHWARGESAPSECFKYKTDVIGAKEVVPIICSENGR